MKRFENKIVLVTGAGRGIGASIAKRFASEGAEVIVNYSGNDEAAQKTVDEITATGGQAQKYKCSVNDSESVKVMIDEIIKEFVRLHQQAHLEHAVYVLLGDARHHQALLGQDGDEPFLFQTAQRIPHGGAADVAHLGAELLLVQKLVGAVLTVQDLGFQVLIRL